MTLPVQVGVRSRTLCSQRPMRSVNTERSGGLHTRNGNKDSNIMFVGPIITLSRTRQADLLFYLMTECVKLYGHLRS